MGDKVVNGLVNDLVANVAGDAAGGATNGDNFGGDAAGNGVDNAAGVVDNAAGVDVGGDAAGNGVNNADDGNGGGIPAVVKNANELPDPVPVMEEDEIPVEDEPSKKRARREQNFTLTCVGADISEDPDVPTSYRFTIQMTNDPGKIYDVEAEQEQFSTALTRWSKKIKTGFLYSPGPPHAFVEKIKNSILDYEERRRMNDEEDLDGGESKPKLRLKQEGVVNIDGQVYFISGRTNVYLFTPDEAPYIKKVSEVEIANLPVKIIYDAREKEYNFEPKEVLEKYLKLIADFNTAQRPQHQTAFVYGCLQNSKGELYLVIEDHRIPVLFCRSTNTGKSMCLLINDKIFNGKHSEIYSGASEAGLRNALERGKAGRFDEIDKTDSSAVTKMMKAIWPPGGGKIVQAHKTIHVTSTVLISTNSYPEDLMKIWRMPQADLTKYDFNHFGETRMEHVNEDFQQIMTACLDQGGKLNHGKPLLLALAFVVLKDRVTGAELAEFDEIVGTRDQRFAQGLVHLKNFCKLLISLADFLEIPEDNIPTSILQPTFNCILKSADMVTRDSERNVSDLISDVCKNPELARKCLMVTNKKRNGIVVKTTKLKETPLWRSWMQPIINKLPEFDSTKPGEERVRGRIVLKEQLDDLFPIVDDLLNLTAEKVLLRMANEMFRKKKMAMKELKENVHIYSAVKERIDDDLELERIDADMEIVREDGVEEEVEAADQEDGADEDILRFEDNFFRCNGNANGCRGKKWKTKRGADNHVTKYH